MRSLNSKRRLTWRSLPVLVAGLLAGAVLMQPAVAHVKKSLSHLTKHLDPRYYNVGEKVGDADTLDGVDSSGFARAGAAYTRAESDARYEPFDSAYTKSESDARYAPTAHNHDDRYVRQVIVDKGSQTATTVTTGAATTSTVAMTVPTSGILLISGSVSVDNQTAVGGNVIVRYNIDGGAYVDGAEALLAATGSVADEQQLAFTDAVSVGAGAHTVNMQTAMGVSTYDYRLANLSVMFVPAGSVT